MTASGNSVDSRVETVFTTGMNNTQHRCSVSLMPGEDRYTVTCEICGGVGQLQEFEGDAEAIARRHEEVGGFERPSR